MVTPVLLLFFNRPDSVTNVIEVLRKVKPPRLYLACDGPRSYVPGEHELVNDLRTTVLNKIDWDCQISTLFLNENSGCRLAVHNAIQWFFTRESKGIVLEDDIVPSVHFFQYCEVLLDRYADNMSIGSITGRNPLSAWGDEEYFCANRFQCWGWGSWSNRVLDIDVSYETVTSNIDMLLKNQRLSIEESSYFSFVRELLKRNEVNSWAYPYDVFFRSKNQLQIYPQQNMVANVGFGTGGTHSTSKDLDTIEVFSDFALSKSLSIVLNPNFEFNRQLLRQEYGSYLVLRILSLYKYIWWLRPPFRIIRRVFRIFL